MDSESRLRIFIYARIVVSFLFLASTVLMIFQDPATAEDQLQMGLVRLMAFSFIFSAISHFAIKLPKYLFFVTYLQTIWDLLFVTVLLLFTGGISSPYSFLYLLSIMNAGVLLGRKEALYTASLCGILYGAIVDFHYFGLLSSIGLYQDDAQQIGASHVFYTIFLNLIGYYLTAFITGYLYERARESEDALRDKTVDYEELHRLSMTIVSNVESGLLTITPTGNIRVFNRYAEELTGICQAEVYDTPLTQVFPDIADDIFNLSTDAAREFKYIAKSGDTLILGYNAVHFTDLNGDPAGIIINFKDLTSIKQMETALKKADRLAVLGEISARMAHEIRNPLAAMSGSVQLLSEQGSIADNDRRLLAIVLREADRLNTLITDFLAYARPTSPHKERIVLRSFIEDTTTFLSADKRFKQVSISNHVPAHLIVQADANQLKQVMINLLHNAADAMPNGGRVELEGRYQLSGSEGFQKAPVSVITVSDTGAGINPVTAVHLFEPFWTTKPDGTGLGLAIIYRIIEAHGGTISSESLPEGGCRFTIMLPL
ncbi:MAG: PAS domain-containing sensor histidine kinase [Desulfuromonadales bacterium GWD2_54_10]|nr:MAG: PAS domain-containing sensor histidine kinase [Desulfuromonadales bacterium GWD2_54_10]